jgi:hypothetical protein
MPPFNPLQDDFIMSVERLGLPLFPSHNQLTSIPLVLGRSVDDAVH